MKGKTTIAIILGLALIFGSIAGCVMYIDYKNDIERYSGMWQAVGLWDRKTGNVYCLDSSFRVDDKTGGWGSDPILTLYLSLIEMDINNYYINLTKDGEVYVHSLYSTDGKLCSWNRHGKIFHEEGTQKGIEFDICIDKLSNAFGDSTKFVVPEDIEMMYINGLTEEHLGWTWLFVRVAK